MWSESFDRLWGDYFLTDFHFPVGLRPGTWFGLVAAIVALLALGATELAKRQAARSNGSRLSATLAALVAVTCAAVVAMVVARHFALALVAYPRLFVRWGWARADHPQKRPPGLGL